MVRPHLPLNALRAFEASARHLSFTRAAIELCVTQAAVSHQVKALETRLGVQLFRRLPRGLVLTDEGVALQPVLAESFDRMAELVEGIASGEATQLLSVAAVGTFATGWLLGCRRSAPRIRESTCGCSPTTTASTWPGRGSIMRSASATGRGTPPRRCR